MIKNWKCNRFHFWHIFIRSHFYWCWCSYTLNNNNVKYIYFSYFGMWPKKFSRRKPLIPNKIGVILEMKTWFLLNVSPFCCLSLSHWVIFGMCSLLSKHIFSILLVGIHINAVIMWCFFAMSHFFVKLK